MRAYNSVVKSLKSMLSASPGFGERGKEEKGGLGRKEGVSGQKKMGGTRGPVLTGPGGRYAPCPESSSYAVRMQES
jgi:hypothetical protein